MAELKVKREPGYLTITEVAKMFAVSKRQVKLALEAKDLKGSRVGRAWVITKEAVVLWIKEKESA